MQDTRLNRCTCNRHLNNHSIKKILPFCSKWHPVEKWHWDLVHRHLSWQPKPNFWKEQCFSQYLPWYPSRQLAAVKYQYQFTYVFIWNKYAISNPVCFISNVSINYKNEWTYEINKDVFNNTMCTKRIYKVY